MEHDDGPAPRSRGEVPWLGEVDAHARACYPEECCGIVSYGGRPATGGGFAVHPCRNIQSDLHARDPDRYPASARTGYFVDPGDYLRIERELAATARAIVAVYHSHVDSGAYFSDSDRRQAAPAGEPLLAGVAYLVVAVIGGQVREHMLYAWDSGLGEYTDAELPRALLRAVGERG